MIRIYVPRDTTACSLGADQVAGRFATAIADAGLNMEVLRNGSRGLYWLEPMVEVDTDRGRIAFGPVGEADVRQLMADRFWEGATEHRLALGLTEEIPFLKNQQRVTFSRVGIIDPLSLKDYCARQGFEGLNAALSMSAQDIVSCITQSGLRGRGGATFATWSQVR